ncbi:MAG: ABC transporter ATP-binding protein/permease [Anaerolineae bacterium]|nr:ABC transporter ATP-binding protein/permease [Anaerolineae bacterium]
MSASKDTKSQAPPRLGFGPRGGPHAFASVDARPSDSRGAMLRLWGYLRRQRLLLAVAIVLVAVTTGLSLLTPYLMGVAIDDYILVGDVDGLMHVIFLFIAIFAGLSLTVWLQSILMIRVAQRTVYTLRSDLFARLQTLSLRFFDQRTHGELMSRLTNDVENVNAVLTESVTSFFSAILTLVGIVIVMFSINTGLALISLIVVPLMALLTRYIARHTRQGFRDQQAALGTLNGLIEETITGGKVIRAYGREQAVIDDFEVVNQRLREASIRAQTFVGTMGPGSNAINNIGFAIITCAGGWMALEGLATIGTIVSFLTYVQQLRRPINEIANLFNTIQAALAGAERVFETLDEVPEMEDAPDAVPLETLDGRVVFDDVTFGYEEDLPVLKHVNLEAAPGQTIALVGPTGAGKTTLINLLSRFYDVGAGSIKVDGHDIRRVRKDDLRRRLGVVLQDTFLFSETVMENIRYGRLDATDEEVIAAARLANADHFIRRLPQGYQTMLSERAENLSQGQRQLLAIARAILADPAILILDEATSSVDTRTEVQIQEAMLRLMAGRTSFVIAHRLSTIRQADRILVLRDGQIVERGTHRELLAQKGFYHHLYMSQFKQSTHLLTAS